MIEKYNGCANWETWEFKQWYEDSFLSQARYEWQACNYQKQSAIRELAEAIEHLALSDLEQTFPEILGSLWGEFISKCIDRIDFYELAEEYIEEIIKEESEFSITFQDYVNNDTKTYEIISSFTGLETDINFLLDGYFYGWNKKENFKIEISKSEDDPYSIFVDITEKETEE